jgi:hypothetical protein
MATSNFKLSCHILSAGNTTLLSLHMHNTSPTAHEHSWKAHAQAGRVCSCVCVDQGASRISDTQCLSLTVKCSNSQLWHYKPETVDTWFSMQSMGVAVGHISLQMDIFPLWHSGWGKCYSSFCNVTGASNGNDLAHHHHQNKSMWQQTVFGWQLAPQLWSILSLYVPVHSWCNMEVELVVDTVWIHRCYMFS